MKVAIENVKNGWIITFNADGFNPYRKVATTILEALQLIYGAFFLGPRKTVRIEDDAD